MFARKLNIGQFSEPLAKLSSEISVRCIILVNNLGFQWIDVPRLPLFSSIILDRHHWVYNQVNLHKIR